MPVLVHATRHGARLCSRGGGRNVKLDGSLKKDPAKLKVTCSVCRTKMNRRGRQVRVRKVQVQVRLTEAEEAKMRKRAERAGKKLSTWMREELLKK